MDSILGKCQTGDMIRCDGSQRCKLDGCPVARRPFHHTVQYDLGHCCRKVQQRCTVDSRIACQHYFSAHAVLGGNDTNRCDAGWRYRWPERGHEHLEQRGGLTHGSTAPTCTVTSITITWRQSLSSTHKQSSSRIVAVAGYDGPHAAHFSLVSAVSSRRRGLGGSNHPCCVC